MNSAIKAILFDLGNVLVELGPHPIPLHYLPKEKQLTLADWLHSETATLFEKGLISTQTFAATFKSDLNIDLSPEKIIEYFTQWPIDLFPGAQNLLETLAPNYKLALLTNTNELHWPRIVNEFKIPNYFEHLFASHLLKMAKPETDIFQHAIKQLAVEPAHILFLDDNLENINAAKRLGIQSLLVKGLTQTQENLVELGILEPPI